MSAPQPRPGILDIAPYIPGGSKAGGGGKIHKLSSNESALGPSPKAMAAYNNTSEGLHLYPDGSSGTLRAKIASLHNLDASRIVCGAGSDEILQLLTRAYTGPENNIIQSDHGFLVYALAAKSCGAEVRFAPERDLTADIDAMADLADDKTTLCFIANPNNPTGSYISDSEIRRLREKLPEHTILVIDSAYAEYMEEADYRSGETLVEEYNNVVMTRTFSKIYGLGGIRLGWGYFPKDIADVINRIRGPFNVSAPAISAGIAALNDQSFVSKNREFNKQERDRMAQRLGDLGLDYKRSFGNFILVHFPNEPGKNARDIQNFLSDNGVIVREMGAYKLNDWLRISIGPMDGNSKCLDLLDQKFSNG